MCIGGPMELISMSRLDDQRRCILVLMRALADGSKELLALVDGEQESKLSWTDLLRNLKAHGLEKGPAFGRWRRRLGILGSLGRGIPRTRQQRCWVHKTANILDKFPKTLQPTAKN